MVSHAAADNAASDYNDLGVSGNFFTHVYLLINVIPY